MKNLIKSIVIAVMIAVFFTSCNKNDLVYNPKNLYYYSNNVDKPNEMNIEKYSISIWLEQVPSNIIMYRVRVEIKNNNGYVDKSYDFSVSNDNKEDAVNEVITTFENKISHSNDNWITFVNDSHQKIYIPRDILSKAINSIYKHT